MPPSKSPRRELLNLWAKKDKGKGPVLFPPDLSPEGGPPPHLAKAYRRLWLDHYGNSLYLDSILKKGWEHTPRPWRRLLALAFSELQWAPEKDLHGVVHDWAEQARGSLGEKSVKVINGTLRTACRDLDKEKAPRNGLPESLNHLLGSTTSRQLLDDAQPLFGFPLSSIMSDETKEIGINYLNHPGLGTVHELLPGTSPKSWAQNHRGFIQNLSAAEVALTVKEQFSGSDFLDFCAAPGGKTWQLLRLGLSQVTFHDHSKKRLEAMQSSSIAQEFRTKLSTLSPNEELLFDGILIDLPCSNSGVLSKCPEAVRHYWTPATSFEEVQEEVFVSALNHLKPAGQLFYSTCSVDPVENEQRVHHLANRYGLKVISEKKWLPDNQGRHGAFLAELKNCE